jgi:hypothetical protein
LEQAGEGVEFFGEPVHCFFGMLAVLIVHDSLILRAARPPGRKGKLPWPALVLKAN